ncbi:Lrp/AsnC ligand binding domain-containing protein [Pseudahrensia aquimaris]|uniref:Lrp/AsnC ligand binding domain-containing protein n=1 Tax=Pseudahrensia aquimaris TaxID=744461 RepID=A0ABW3FLH2_9HYPH
MSCIFVQLRCKPGTAYQVADTLFDRDVISQLFSTSGEWDLLAQIYPPDGEDVGKWVNDNILDVPGIERSLTTLTFKAF